MARCGPHLADNVELVFEREAARTGETDSAAEEVFGHLASVARATGVQGLQVHRFPDGAGLDVGGGEDAYEFIARAAQLGFFDEEATEPVGVHAVRGLWHERDAGEVSKCIPIAEGDGAPLPDTEVQNFELATADTSQHVAHAVVVTEFGVFVSKAGITGLLGPEAGLFDPGGVGGNEHAAAGGCDHLVAVEGERSHFSERAGRAVAICSAEGFGGVFEHRHAVAEADCQDGVHVGALSIEVDHYDGAREFVLLRALVESVFEDVRVQVPGGAIAVQEYGLCAEIADWITAGDEGERRAKDFIAGPNPEKTQAEMNGGGAAGKRDGLEAEASFEILLEG